MTRTCPCCGNTVRVIELAVSQRRLHSTIAAQNADRLRDGESLQMQRAKAGMMLREAAHLLGIPVAALSQIEEGLRTASAER